MVLRQIGLHQLGCLRLPQIYALPDENPPPPGRKSGRSGTTEIYGKNGKSQIGQHDVARHFFAQVRGFEDFGRVRGALGGSIFVRVLFGCGSVKRRTEQLGNRPNRTFCRTEHGKKLPNRTAPEPNKSGPKNRRTEPNLKVRSTTTPKPLTGHLFRHASSPRGHAGTFKP